MTLSEPTTTVTDYVLALLAGGLGWRLWRRAEPGDARRRAWAGAFAGLAAAALLGGTTHGFGGALGPTAERRLWLLTMTAVGVTGALVLFAGLTAVVGSSRALRRWRLGLAAEVAVFAAWVGWVDSDFRYAVVQYGIAMAVTLAIHLTPAVRRRPGSWTLVAGILVSFAAAGIQQAGIAPHPAFNHNDLYHVVQMVGLVLLYRGAAAPRGTSPAGT